MGGGNVKLDGRNSNVIEASSKWDGKNSELDGGSLNCDGILFSLGEGTF